MKLLYIVPNWKQPCLRIHSKCIRHVQQCPDVLIIFGEDVKKARQQFEAVGMIRYTIVVTRRSSVTDLAKTVDRYLDALRGSSLQIRRRERSNCNSLLRFLKQSGALELSGKFVETWLDRAGEANSDTRLRRFSTLRRLVALSSGKDTIRVAQWLDHNRKRLLGARSRLRVVPIRSLLETSQQERDEGDRYAKEAERWFEEGSRARARPLAKRALKHNPACLRAHALLGRLELDADRPERALRQLRQALVMAGDLGAEPDVNGIGLVLDGLGQAMIYVGHVDDAYDVYTRVVRISQAWESKVAPTMGRLALLRDNPVEAANWFQLSGESLRHYNVFLAHVEAGEPMRAMIALGRGFLTNPIVPTELLASSEGRFEDSLDDELAASMRDDAHAYAISHRELWDRDPTIRDLLETLWDHAATRSFLIRALPVAQRNPQSARLAVFIHTMASKLTDFVVKDGLIVVGKGD